MNLFPDWLRQHLGFAEPAVSEARPEDAALLAALHGAAFLRGWSTEEFEQLLAQTKFGPIDIREDLIGLELALERT